MRDLHGGDVLEELLDAATAVGAVALKGQQREELAVVGLVAVDVGGRAAAGGRAVQHRAQVALQQHAQHQ